MAENKIVLCDTDILIEFYKKNSAIVDELRKIGQENIAASIVTEGELIQGSLNKKELHQLQNDFQHIRVFEIDHKICDVYKELLFTYSLSHGLRVADAFIAATALVHNCEFYTLNKKDFRFIKNLSLYNS